MHYRDKRFLVTAAFAVLWTGAVAFGLRTLFAYEHRPGAVGVVAKRWPGLQVQLASDRPTLVMVAHPLCTCTRASMTELAQIMAAEHDKIAAYVLFITPENPDPNWNDTSLETEAAHIPGVTVVRDVDGAEARRLGAETSGHTFLFAPNGRLLFTGGITGSRGHEGENAGEDAIVSLLRNQTAAIDQTYVFGCALNDPSRRPEAKEAPR